MQPSLGGLIVCAGVLLAGYLARGTLIVSLIASLAFGATAVASVPALGGSSPLIYTLFAAMLLTAVAGRRRIWRDLGTVFGSMRPLWVLGSLLVYAAVGAWLFPRLFAGLTSVFVQSKLRQGVIETVLEPVSANISQTGYFLLGGFTTIALCVLLLNEKRMVQVQRGFMLWCGLHAGMGLVDIFAKVTGAGDVLQPIRTANYAMLTNASEAGFFRIAGAYSEASAFGTASLACLAFTYTYWRKTGSRLARWLSVLLLVLLMLSTSSTAYAGLAILLVPVAYALSRSLLSGRLTTDELLILAGLAAMATAALAIELHSRGFFDPFLRLIEATVTNKAQSASGQERAYWNVKSLQAFSDTSGLGVGFGSSRASSWAIAVLSQLGLIGALTMATLVAVMVRGMGTLRGWIDGETEAVVASVRASTLASIVVGSLVNGSADPGMIFFIGLAVVMAARTHARRNRRATVRSTAATALGRLVPAA
ncbi:hypothetical protein [Aminobacter sp. Piv2-1]|uniref:hypothetical protein n=1 Tax=Aminobacter sp. Piv2-1 TaxID=3031122 RepID=UPI0030B0ED93